jgi:hypothetical protein
VGGCFFFFFLTKNRTKTELLSEDLGVESSLTKFGQLFATNSGGQRLLVLQMGAHANALSADELEVLMVQDIDQVAKFPRTKVGTFVYFVLCHKKNCFIKLTGADAPLSLLRRCLSENVAWIVARDVVEDMKSVSFFLGCCFAFAFKVMKGVLNDVYFASRKVCSAMVVQIRNQEKVQGLVYLENNKLAGVFHQAMAKSLSTLVAQLGISLKNAQLFEELVSGFFSYWRLSHEKIRIEVMLQP